MQRHPPRLPALAASIALFLLLVGAAASTAAAGAHDAERWMTRLDDALAAAEDGDRFILVDLYADWCGWCKVLEKEVFASPDFRAATDDWIYLRVDVEDGGEGSMLQARYAAQSLPTTLVIKPSMALVGKISGYAPMPRFAEILQGEIESYERFVKLFESRRGSDDPSVLKMLAEAALQRGDGVRAAIAYQALLPHIESDKKAWMHFQIADSYRISRRFEHAVAALERAKTLTSKNSAHPLAEKLDLLRFQIDLDRRDCAKAKASIEHFLEAHPTCARPCSSSSRATAWYALDVEASRSCQKWAGRRSLRGRASYSWAFPEEGNLPFHHPLINHEPRRP